MCIRERFKEEPRFGNSTKHSDHLVDFSSRVPLFKYEDFAGKIDRARKGENNIFWPSKIKWFAQSSGTTNSKSKFIPVSNESLEECHYAASKDLLCMYLNNNEDSMLFAGKSLRLGGSKSPYKKNGTYYGDLSAILIDNMPIWFEYSSCLLYTSPIPRDQRGSSYAGCA